MSLLRTQIRAAILTRLSTLKDYQLFDSPVYPLASRDLPALTVTAEKETVVSDGSTLGKDGICTHTYELPIVLEGVIQGMDNLHAQCEAMALRVMEALQADLTLGGLCKALRWDTGADILTASEGEQPVARMRLTATVLYRAAENAPQQACD